MLSQINEEIKAHFERIYMNTLFEDRFVDLIKDRKISSADFEIDSDGKISLHTGILNECDISIEIDIKSITKFYPGG